MSSIRKFVTEHRGEIVIGTLATVATAVIIRSAYKHGVEAGYSLGRIKGIDSGRLQIHITKDFFEEAKRLNLV